MTKYLILILIALGGVTAAWYFGALDKNSKPSEKANLFSEVNFSQLMSTNRSIDDEARVHGKPDQSIINSQNKEPALSPRSTPLSKNPSAINQTTSVSVPPPSKAAPIDLQKVGNVTAPQATAALINQMLIASNNSIKLIELKSQIESVYPKPEKGDVKLARALNQQGLAAFSQENYSEAANLFLEGAKANPADVEVLNNFAYALLKKGSNQSSEQILGYVLSLAPGRTSAWANLGEVYANLNRVDSAAAAYVIGFQFSGNKEKTLEYLSKTYNESTNSALKDAISKALSQLSNS